MEHGDWQTSLGWKLGEKPWLLLLKPQELRSVSVRQKRHNLHDGLQLKRRSFQPWRVLLSEFARQRSACQQVRDSGRNQKKVWTTVPSSNQGWIWVQVVLYQFMQGDRGPEISQRTKQVKAKDQDCRERGKRQDEHHVLGAITHHRKWYSKTR